MDFSEWFSVGIKPGYILSFPFAIARFWEFFPPLKELYPNTSCILHGLPAAHKISGFLAALFQNNNLINCEQRSKTVCITKKIDYE